MTTISTHQHTTQPLDLEAGVAPSPVIGDEKSSNETKPCSTVMPVGGNTSTSASPVPSAEITTTPPPPPPEKQNQPYPWHLILPNLSPAWFSSTMGTGITAILMHTLPPFRGQPALSTTLFALNAMLFLILTILSLTRLVLLPKACLSTLLHPVQSLFLGTVPMGLATIVNLTVMIYGSRERAVTVAWGLWWVDVALSLATAIGIPFLLTTVSRTRRAPKSLQSMTAALLLPIVAPIVAAASGGVVAEGLVAHGNQVGARVTVVVSYIVWGTGVPLAMCVLVVYFQRLMCWQAVGREVAVSVFLPLGPLGQGAFGIMQLGKVARTLAPEAGVGVFLSPVAGEVFYAGGTMVGLVIWGFGVVWLVWAVTSVVRWWCTGGFPFNLGWWAFTFPMGVFTTATLLFAQEFGNAAFRVVGTGLSVTVAILWTVVFSATAWETWTGGIFRA